MISDEEFKIVLEIFNDAREGTKMEVRDVPREIKDHFKKIVEFIEWGHSSSKFANNGKGVILYRVKYEDETEDIIDEQYVRSFSQSLSKKLRKERQQGTLPEVNIGDNSECEDDIEGDSRSDNNDEEEESDIEEYAQPHETKLIVVNQLPQLGLLLRNPKTGWQDWIKPNNLKGANQKNAYSNWLAKENAKKLSTGKANRCIVTRSCIKPKPKKTSYSSKIYSWDKIVKRFRMVKLLFGFFSGEETNVTLQSNVKRILTALTNYMSQDKHMTLSTLNEQFTDIGLLFSSYNFMFAFINDTFGALKTTSSRRNSYYSLFKIYEMVIDISTPKQYNRFQILQKLQLIQKIIKKRYICMF